MKDGRSGKTAAAAMLGTVAVILILVIGTIWTGDRARQDTEESVRTVSLLYLDELAGRREQVVSANLKGIDDLGVGPVAEPAKSDKTEANEE